MKSGQSLRKSWSNFLTFIMERMRLTNKAIPVDLSYLSQLKELGKLFGMKFCPPKIKGFLWRLLQGSVPFKSKLLSHGVVIDLVCYRCWQAKEDWVLCQLWVWWGNFSLVCCSSNKLKKGGRFWACYEAFGSAEMWLYGSTKSRPQFSLWIKRISSCKDGWESEWYMLPNWYLKEWMRWQMAESLSDHEALSWFRSLHMDHTILKIDSPTILGSFLF